MGLINCSECFAKISDKATCCPRCGASIKIHKWRCSKCGNLVNENPCPYCENQQPSTNNSAVHSIPDATPEFVEKNKRNLGIIITILIITIIGIFIIASSLQKSSNSQKSGYISNDPNRTKEKCAYFGTTNVYGSAHQSTISCTPDGDGWYNPSFGHHHHK